jgi:hypothetical protein
MANGAPIQRHCGRLDRCATALLEQDVKTIEKLLAKLLPRYAVPLVVSGTRTKAWKKCRWYPVALADAWGYSSNSGAYQQTVCTLGILYLG